MQRIECQMKTKETTWIPRQSTSEVPDMIMRIKSQGLGLGERWMLTRAPWWKGRVKIQSINTAIQSTTIYIFLKWSIPYFPKDQVIKKNPKELEVVINQWLSALTFLHRTAAWDFMPEHPLKKKQPLLSVAITQLASPSHPFAHLSLRYCWLSYS